MFASDKLQIAKGPDCENAKGLKVLMETVNVRGVFVIDTLVLFAFRNERVSNFKNASVSISRNFAKENSKFQLEAVHS